MTPGRHAFVSGLAAWGCGELWGPGPAAAAFAAGTLIDLDHLIDWRLNRMGRFTPARFMNACVRFELPKFYLFAHSLEWIVPFLVYALACGVPPVIRAAGLGLLAHILMDLCGNGTTPLAYSLIWRWRRRFEARRLVVALPPTALARWGSLAAYRRGARQA